MLRPMYVVQPLNTNVPMTGTQAMEKITIEQAMAHCDDSDGIWVDGRMYRMHDLRTGMSQFSESARVTLTVK